MFEIKNKVEAAKAIKTLSQQYADDIRVRIRSYPPKIEVDLLEPRSFGDTRYAGFTLEQQPECCGVMVSTQTFVIKERRDQGIGTAMMNLKEAIAKEFGYKLLTATVVEGNEAEQKILKKFGWTKHLTFKNDRTTNDVSFWSKILE